MLILFNSDDFVKSLEPRLVKLFRTVGANNHSPAIRANDYSPLQRTRRESGDKSRLFTKPSILFVHNTLFNGKRRQCRGAVQVQLGHYIGPVLFNRLYADVQQLADFLVIVAFGKQF